MAGDSGGDPPKHVVVVLSWNGKVDTVRCIESLLDGSPEVSILVVDNGSFDGTLDEVRARWPNIDTLQTGENRGFAGGMNSGIRQALRAGADHVTILNNDTVVLPGVMRQLQAAAGAELAVSPMVMYRDAPERVWFGGGTLDEEDGYPHHTDESDLEPCHDGLRRTPLLAGCCITAHRAVWNRVGLFDERFFLNFEDSEWSVRAGRLGVGLAVVCEPRILHSVSASFRGAAATLGTYYYLRNGLLFNRLVGASFRSRVRFLRRHALPTLRRGTPRTIARTFVVTVWAVAAYAVRRFGPAPKPLQAIVRRWHT